jgi:hypothetical protein
MKRFTLSNASKPETLHGGAPEVLLSVSATNTFSLSSAIEILSTSPFMKTSLKLSECTYSLSPVIMPFAFSCALKTVSSSSAIEILSISPLMKTSLKLSECTYSLSSVIMPFVSLSSAMMICTLYGLF